MILWWAMLVVCECTSAGRNWRPGRYTRFPQPGLESFARTVHLDHQNPFFHRREVLLGAVGMQVHRKIVIYSMPRVSQDMLPSEVMKLPGIHHEGQQVALLLLQRFIEQPY